MLIQWWANVVDGGSPLGQQGNIQIVFQILPMQLSSLSKQIKIYGGIFKCLLSHILYLSVL